MTTPTPKLSATQLDLLLFELAARCKEKPAATIATQECLLACQELQEWRAQAVTTMEDTL